MIEIRCLRRPVVPMISVKSSYSLQSSRIPNDQIKKKKKTPKQKKTVHVRFASVGKEFKNLRKTKIIAPSSGYMRRIKQVLLSEILYTRSLVDSPRNSCQHRWNSTKVPSTGTIDKSATTTTKRETQRNSCHHTSICAVRTFVSDTVNLY